MDEECQTRVLFKEDLSLIQKALGLRAEGLRAYFGRP